jgi:IclR family transcriptional regulator, pca regulon regulatory protein
LLAALPAYELRQYLETTEFAALTPHTLTDPRSLRTTIEAVYRDGYALGDEGLELGLYAAAVPVTDGRGTVVGALGVATHAGSPSPADLRDGYVPALRDCADDIGQQLRRTSAATRP